MLKKILLVLFLLLPLTVARAVDAPLLLISEVQIFGKNGEDHNDYIKIYNNSTGTIDLDNYRLAKMTDSGKTYNFKSCWSSPTPLLPGGFYLWANSEGGFATSTNANCATTDIISNNNGVAIISESTGEPADKLAWGNILDNFIFVETKHFPENPKAGQTLRRKNNNQDTDNNSVDFELTGVVTPPADNPPANNPAPASSGGGSIYCQATKGDVLINEFLSSPGEDEEEWVELVSNCSQAINLEGWTLEDGSGAKTTLSGTFEKYFVIDAPKGKLNNAGDLVILQDGAGNVIDQILYGAWDEQAGASAPAAGQSLARRQDGIDTDNLNDWALTDTPTKGQTNIIETVNEPDANTADTDITSATVMITEILPNPLGADDQTTVNGYEFIELFNQTDKEINLTGWRLAAGEQKNYVFGEQVLAAKNYLILKRNQTSLVLNNDKSTIKLYKPEVTAAQQSISYGQAPEGLSYAYDAAAKTWSWSMAKTPGAANLIIKPNQPPKIIVDAPENLSAGQAAFFDGSDSFDPEGDKLTFAWKFSDGSQSQRPSVEKLLTDKDTNVQLTVSDGWLSASQTIKLKTAGIKTAAAAAVSADNAANKTGLTEIKAGLFKIEGIAVTAPGVFGSQYFYLAPLDETGKTADAVIQVYNSKKDFPAVKQGDYLEITGELYAISTDTRLKIASAKDITVLDHDYILVEKRLEISQLKAELHNQLLTVGGKITDKKSNGFFLDDGTGEIWVEFKSGVKLSAKNYEAGQNYQVTGLLRQEKSGLKLFPRAAEDITAAAAETPAVLGEKINQAANSSQPVPITTANAGRQPLWEYAAIASWGIMLGLAVLAIKKQFIKK